jgi:hypothetical protein
VPRVAVLGSIELLAESGPRSAPGTLEVVAAPAEPSPERLRALGVDAVVAFEPDQAEVLALAEAGLPALLWCDRARAQPAGAGQRLVSPDGRPGAWRSVSLPVADARFAAGLPELPARAAWIGPRTPRRAGYDDWFRHTQPFADDGEEAAVAVNIHAGDEPAFEPCAVGALAAGCLLVSETLVPARGLEAGVDYLGARDLDDVYLAVESAVSEPHAFRRIRLRGRRKAELFRSSSVVARLVGDLLLELRSASA